MEIEHVDGKDDADVLRQTRARLQAMRPAELAAQQCMLAGAYDALSELVKRGVIHEEVEIMLASTAHMLGMVAGTAKQRGIQLPVFVPGRRTEQLKRKTH